MAPPEALTEEMVELLKKTWKILYRDENLGIRLFMTLFEIYPDAKVIFKLKEGTDLRHSSKLKGHSTRVVSTINLLITQIDQLEG